MSNCSFVTWMSCFGLSWCARKTTLMQWEKIRVDAEIETNVLWIGVYALACINFGY